MQIRILSIRCLKKLIFKVITKIYHSINANLLDANNYIKIKNKMFMNIILLIEICFMNAFNANKNFTNIMIVIHLKSIYNKIKIMKFI